MIPCDCKLAHYSTTTTTIYGYTLMLMLIEYMERYRVGFGRTESTLVLIHVWIDCVCVISCLVGIRCTWHHTIVNSPATQLQRQRYTDVYWCWCWLNIWNVFMLALGKQAVRWYWCMFEFECVIAWCTMYNDTYSTAMEIHYNDNDIQLCVWNGVVLVLDKQAVRWY